MKGCVFENWDANFQQLEEFILRQAAAGQPVVLGPIQSSMYPLPPKVGLAICKQAGDQAHGAVMGSGHKPFTYPGAPRHLGGGELATGKSDGAGNPLVSFFFGGAGGDAQGSQLGVGYVTSHFTSSSIGREMLFLLGAHSKRAVAAHCYALNADDGSWLQHTWRSNIARACHQFRDLSGMDDAAAAAAVNQDQIHILIDLNGWSGGHRVHLIR